MMQCMDFSKGLRILFIGLLTMGAMSAQAEQTPNWVFDTEYSTRDTKVFVPGDKKVFVPGDKSLCLYQETAVKFLVLTIPTWKIKVDHEPCVAHFLANQYNHKIAIINGSISAQDAIGFAKDAGIIKILDESIAEDARKQRQKYLDDYSAANTLEAINSFEVNYATNDPDGFIPLLQPKKKELTYTKYKNAFDNAKAPDDLSSFIRDYESNDPDGLVPLAKNKLDAIWEADEKQRRREKEAEEFRIRSEKEAKKAENAKILAQVIAKHKSEINSLGFSNKFLKANLYIYQDYVNRPVTVFTFETWLALLFESGKYSNIKKVEARGAQGVLLKRPGMQSGGILFKFDGGDLFPSHTTNGDKAFPIENAEGRVSASMMILSAFQ